MHVRDSSFSHLDNKTSQVALHFAEMKKSIISKKATDQERSLWESVPTVSATSKHGDVVKDFSVDRTQGHVGVVVGLQSRRKRDGRSATVIEVAFNHHTTLKPAYRKIEIIDTPERS